jgi:hypothetical protein
MHANPTLPYEHLRHTHPYELTHTKLNSEHLRRLGRQIIEIDEVDHHMRPCRRERRLSWNIYSHGESNPEPGVPPQEPRVDGNVTYLGIFVPTGSQNQE